MLRIEFEDVVTIKQVENSIGYDGHCLRTYAYAEGTEHWYNKVRQAEPSEETFKVTIGEETHYLKGTDTVMDSTGKELTVTELAILLQANKPNQGEAA